MVAMKLIARIASLVPLLAVAAVVAVVVLEFWSLTASGQSDLQIARGDGTPVAVVDDQGNLHVPSNYRTAYEFLGTWAIAANNGVGSSQLHAVYANPGTTAAYHTSGHFPDGTVLIKEVYEIG